MLLEEPAADAFLCAAILDPETLEQMSVITPEKSFPEVLLSFFSLILYLYLFSLILYLLSLLFLLSSLV